MIKMKRVLCCLLILYIPNTIQIVLSPNYDDMDNSISPEDINFFADNNIVIPYEQTLPSKSIDSTNASIGYFQRLKNKIYGFFNTTKVKNHTEEVVETVDCFGLGSITRTFSWILNLKPAHADKIKIVYHFYNREQKDGVFVLAGDQFGLDWVKYKPKNPTIIIVHGFMSYSKAKWVLNMTKAYLERDDVNVITVDWSRGGNTWKYWRAVANTRTVGADLALLLQQTINATGARTKDFHFIGHSLGAHICSYAAAKLGNVKRITGLDPAQPCFITTDLDVLLDKSDAEFVDVIHTNGRLLSKLGLGLPNTCGHQDFYPNGGRKQPGCHTGNSSIISRVLPITYGRLQQAICNHGRAYLLFTESLKKHNCTLLGRRWNHQYSGINASIHAPCNIRNCSELGIEAINSRARGSLYVMTSSNIPYCAMSLEAEVRSFLLNDLHNQEKKSKTTRQATTKKPKMSFYKRALSVFG